MYSCITIALKNNNTSYNISGKKSQETSDTGYLSLKGNLVLGRTEVAGRSHPVVPFEILTV